MELHPDKLDPNLVPDEKEKKKKGSSTKAKTALDQKQYFILLEMCKRV